MNIYVFLAGIAVAVALFMAGVKTGHTYAENTTIAADLKRADRMIVQQQVLVREVPKIVTRVVTKEVEVVKEVERVVVQSHHLVAPDCVLPDNFGMLLVAAANGVDPEAAGSADAFRGGYGCRESLAAILTDLSAGWRNSTRLAGLQEWANLVTQEKTP